MKKMFKDNLRKITALLLVASITMTLNSSAFAQEFTIQNDIIQDDFIKDETIIVENNLDDETEAEICNELIEEDNLLETSNDGTEVYTLGSISREDEEARERECMPASSEYLKKFLTYLSLKYPEIGIDPKYGADKGDKTQNPEDDLYNWYNSTKMARQKVYHEIVIDGNDTFADFPDLTKNMTQFKYLGSFGKSIGSDAYGESVYSDTVKTLIIRNVDEIRNLYIPASVETLIIENTTLNCYYYYKDSPGFQCGMIPGDLKYCENLKKLVLKNVKFGDNYKRGDAANLLPEITNDCPYETKYVLNLQNCHNLEELVIDVSFEGAQEVQLAIDGGSDNLFEKLTDDKCKINPAPGTGYGQVNLYANDNSYLAKRYNSSETVDFKNKQFRFWLIDAIGVDSDNDGVISQDELDAIDTLTINNQTAHSASQTSLSAFQELADIGKMHGLKTLEIDLYEPGSNHETDGKRMSLKGIDFPDSLENLTMRNIYWEKDTQTKSHKDADIRLTNLRTLTLYNTDVKVGEGDSYFNHSTQIELEDKKGVLQSVMIERTDVESIKLTNNSNGVGIKAQDEKQRIRFSAVDCQQLKNVEFLGEGYAVEGSLDLSNDIKLTHIGVPNEDRTRWTVYGEFDSSYAPTNVVLNSCVILGSDCNEVVIDYDFINGRSINVQTMDTDFCDSSDDSDAHELTIYRRPRLEGDTAGNVYLFCDEGSWVYNHYKDEEGFVIENRTSIPTIAAFGNGQRMRTSGEGNHNNDSIYTKDTDCWVERWNLVMQPGGYSTDFGNLTFFVIDKVPNPKQEGGFEDTLRRVFYKGDVYVEWDNPIITLPTTYDGKGYKLTGTKLLSTGVPGEVELKLYVYDDKGNQSYIGYQNIKVFELPDSVELVNDGTERGNGTKDDPYIVDKDEELKLKARLLVNDKVDRAGDYVLRDVYWRIKEYDEPRKYTSDSDGYSLYTLDTATKAGISVVRGELNEGETEAQYDSRTDNTGVDGEEPTYYNHRRFSFNTAGSKFKIVAQMPYKNKDTVITKEVFVEYHSIPLSIDISNDIIHGKKGCDEATITINDVYNVNSVNVSIKNPELYDDCFTLSQETSSVDGKEIWKLKIDNSDIIQVKNVINSNNGCITLVINADGKKYEKTINLSSVYPNAGKFWCSEIEDQIYTGKAIKPKLNIYYGDFLLKEGRDYTLSYSNNVKAASKTAVNKNGKRIGPSVTINGIGNYSNKHIYYFSIIPCSIENTAKVGDILVAKTNKNIQIKPTVVLGGKKLKQGVDYIVSTTADKKDAIVSLKDANVYPLYVVGKGNYTGAVPFKFTITSLVLASKTTIKTIANQKYDGSSIQPAVNITYNKKDVTDCFDIEYENNKEIGTATVIVTAKKNDQGEAFKGKAGYSFAGGKKTTFKITGTQVKNAKLGANGKGTIPSHIYDGQPYEPELDLYVGTTKLIKGDDYTVTYKKNVNAGKATAKVTGKGRYTGTKDFTFKISQYNAGNDVSGLIAINNGAVISANYIKGGVTPKPAISMNGISLVEKKDYTIKYANNNAVAGLDAVNSKGKSIAPAMVITFKGNFSGKKSVKFVITGKDIHEGKITINDKAYSTKADAWKQTTVTIVDTNGKKLKAGTDYSKTFRYYSDPLCTKEITEKTIASDTLVYVKVKGIKNYDNSDIVGSYRISEKDISKVNASIASQTFTGNPICPLAEDITVMVGSTNKKTRLTAGVDYEIVAGSYKNNTNKGTASVTIRGIGNYYGTKVVKYKIVVNKILWWSW